MRKLKLVVICLSALLIIGCSNSLDKFGQNDEYLNKNAAKSKSIAVPRDLDSGAIENYYPIPQPKSNDRSTAEVLAIPPGFKG